MYYIIKALKRVYINVIYIILYNLNNENYIILFINEATFIKWGYIFIIKNKAFNSINFIKLNIIVPLRVNA